MDDDGLSSAASRLDGLFRSLNLTLYIPEDHISEPDLASLTADPANLSSLIDRISGPQRTQLYYDEGLTTYVALILPGPSKEGGFTEELAHLLLESKAWRISLDACYLDASPSTGVRGGILSPAGEEVQRHNVPALGLSVSPAVGSRSGSPMANHAGMSGLGVQSPGFPFTPIPFPGRPGDDSKIFDGFRDGQNIGNVVWEGAPDTKSAERWIGTNDKGAAVVVWRLRLQRLVYIPSNLSPPAIAVTATCAFDPNSASAQLIALLPETDTNGPPVPRKAGQYRRKSVAGAEYVPISGRGENILAALDDEELSLSLDPSNSGVISRGSDSSALQEGNVSHSITEDLRTLRRSFRRIVPVRNGIDVELRAIRSFSLDMPGGQIATTLCIELANNLSDTGSELPFFVSQLRVCVDGSVRGVRPLGSTIHTLVLQPNDQVNLAFELTSIPAAISTVKSTSLKLPPTTPLAALLTPSQVFTQSRPFDPRMQNAVPREGNGDPQQRHLEVQVSVRGRPVHHRSVEDTAPEKPELASGPTELFTSTWDMVILEGEMKQKPRRRTTSTRVAAPVGPGAALVALGTGGTEMSKQATSIGVRSSIAMQQYAGRTPESVRDDTRKRTQTLAAVVNSPLVQATAGSKRHTVAGLLQASTNMTNLMVALPGTPGGAERAVALSRGPSRAGTPLPNLSIGMGQPSGPRSALPLHMQTTRPVPQRSFSTPTVNSPPQQATPSQSHVSNALSPPSPHGTQIESPLPPSSGASGRATPTRRFTDMPGSPNLTARDYALNSPKSVRVSDPFEKHPHRPAAPSINGRISISIRLLSMRETSGAGECTPSQGKSLGSEDPNVGGATDPAAVKSSFARFKFGGVGGFKDEASVRDDAHSDAAVPVQPGSARKCLVPVHVYDIFLVEVFILNESTAPATLTIRTPIKSGPQGSNGILPLDGEAIVEPLDPGCCQSVRLRYLAVCSGVHAVQELAILDHETGHEHVVRKPILAFVL